MTFLANVLWFLCGGWAAGLVWLTFGLLWCCTILGIPLGLQCFKMAGLSAAPFGKEVVYGGGTGSFIANVLWILFTGVPMAVGNLLAGIAMCVTLIGIPFGLQFFKLAKLSLMPFGTQVLG